MDTNLHCGAAIFDGVTKIVSYALRSGMEPQDAVKVFSGIICSKPALTPSARHSRK